MSTDPATGVPQAEPESPWPGGGVLVGVDGSAESVAALREAKTLAEKLGTPLHAVVCWDYPDLAFGDVTSPEILAYPKEDADHVLRTVTRDVFGAEVPDWFTGSVHRGRPAPSLIRLSRGAAMLVVGSRGRGGFIGLLLGSVSSACVAHAECPVLVVPRPAG